MQDGLQKRPQIKILPAISIDDGVRLQEADIDEVVKTVQQGILPKNIDEDIDVTITLLEKNLKIMADMALMKEALVHLVRNAMPGCDALPMTINHVNFEMESLLSSDDSIMGGCAFIPLAGVGKYLCVDDKIKEKIFEPFFTTKTDGNGLGLAMAYRIIRGNHESIKAARRVQYGAEVNIYLPLTKYEMVEMMSIPTG